MDFEDSVRIETTQSEIKKLFTYVLYDNPNIFWVDSNYLYTPYENSIELTPQYRLSKTEAEMITSQMQSEIQKIRELTSGFTNQFDKELYIHDYICRTSVYDEGTIDNFGDTAHSVLLYGKGICEGYSRAAQILLDAVGIDNYLVVGESTHEGKTEAHMWNVVNIDGINYHLDVTWDDYEVENDILYFYFNLNDEKILKDHYNLDPAVNSCISLEHYYFMYKDSYVKDFSGFDAYISSTAKKLSEGENKIEFLFEDKKDLQKALSNIENDSGFFNFVAVAVKESGMALDTNSVDYYYIEEYNYLCVIFKEG